VKKVNLKKAGIKRQVKNMLVIQEGRGMIKIIIKITKQEMQQRNK
jgi:hypothetical protein